MKRVTNKIRPTGGFSQIFHLLLTVILPISVYILIRLNLVQLAIILIVISKWRIFAVRPRYWLALIRTNAVDIIFGISTVIFMVNTSTALIQLIWAVIYAVWLVLIKPSSSLFGVSMQAFIAFVYGLVAIYLEWGSSSAVIIMIMTWLVCYSVARHFLTGFDETHVSFLSNIWALFGACLAWLMSHWLLYYQMFSQVALLLIVLGFGFSTLYYLEQTDRLSKLLKRQIIFIMLAVIIITIAFSDWSYKTITN
jgi:hypothetical protein